MEHFALNGGPRYTGTNIPPNSYNIAKIALNMEHFALNGGPRYTGTNIPPNSPDDAQYITLR